MSKIYEALENAEKQKTVGSNKRTPFVLGPKPKEEKKTAPVPGSSPAPATRPTPPPAAKEEKKTSPAPEHATVLGLREEKQISPVPEPKKGGWASAAGFSAPGPKEEKRTAPVLQPKGEKTERQPVVLPPKTTGKPIRPDKSISDHPLVSLFEPGSLGAEQFRKLRTHVLKLNMSDPPKTIMVTSATEGEGKTFVAANLAAGIAHDLHFHALLVDCDLRNPNLSQWFGVQNGHGLSDYLVGRGNLSELLVKTRMDKLIILTGGSIQEKPAELIGSKKMEALIHELKSRYADRYIILDSTPLLATTEPEVLARLVDGIVIVVRANVTPRETVKQAVASLDPKKILGFVLNNVEFKSSGLFSRYFGSDGYYASYGYGKRGDEPRSKSGEISPFRKRSG